MGLLFLFDPTHVQGISELSSLAVLKKVDLRLVIVAIVRSRSWEATVVINALIIGDDVCCRATLIAVMSGVGAARAANKLLTCFSLI